MIWLSRWFGRIEIDTMRQDLIDEAKQTAIRANINGMRSREVSARAAVDADHFYALAAYCESRAKELEAQQPQP